MTEYDLELTQAKNASRQGDLAAAIDAFLAAHRLQPDAMEPLFRLAAEYATQGDVPRAEEAFAASIVRAPDFFLARFQLGLLQLVSGRASQAALTWEPLLNDQQHPYWSSLTGAYLLFQAGSPAEAVEKFERAHAAIHDNAPLAADVAESLRRAREAAASQAGQRPELASAEAATDNGQASHHVLLSGYTGLPS